MTGEVPGSLVSGSSEGKGSSAVEGLRGTVSGDRSGSAPNGGPNRATVGLRPSRAMRAMSLRPPR